MEKSEFKIKNVNRTDRVYPYAYIYRTFILPIRLLIITIGNSSVPFAYRERRLNGTVFRMRPQKWCGTNKDSFLAVSAEHGSRRID